MAQKALAILRVYISAGGNPWQLNAERHSSWDKFFPNPKMASARRKLAVLPAGTSVQSQLLVRALILIDQLMR